MVNEEASNSQAEELCKACGLCCTGHLFIWVKLKAAELDAAEASGLTVFRADPTQRGFSVPCPLWKGLCTIHSTSHYPRTCRAYRCKLLKEVMAENVPLEQGLAVIGQTKQLIGRIEAVLPPSPNPNFRERVVEQIEHPESRPDQEAYTGFRRLADELLGIYAERFGVSDWLE
jgi:hypothetical protein